jgi:TetR/AcrR family fatty acid metabolism transcriptional regulator
MFSDYLKRKDNIIIAAIDLLDEVGIQGMTTKEIARRQNITEPAIYKQFSGKKEIILAMLNKFSDFDHSLYNTIIEQNMECIKGIRYFLSTFADYYQTYPQLATIMLSYDLYRYDLETNEKMKNIIYGRHKLIGNIIEKGQLTGEFKKTISKDDASEIILGVLHSAIYNWKLENSNYSLNKKISGILDHIISDWSC